MNSKATNPVTKERFDGLVLVMLGAVAFLVIGIAWRHVSPIESGDFKVVYYSARCLLQNEDPYRESDVLRVYQSEGRENPSEPLLDRQVKTRFFYPPTAFLVSLPFAMMGFEVGQLAWTVFLAGSLILAAVFAWDLGADYAPIASGVLVGLLLMNSFWLFMIGNSAGIAVCLCVVAVWCMYRQRFVWVGVLCLALSLALKPNDSGLIWLVLLFSGKPYRRRSLQALAVLSVLSLPIVLWVSHASPHWLGELRGNMASLTGIGSIVDPAATGMAGRNMDSLVQLQTFVSIFFPDPATYNLMAWIVCAPLILVAVFLVWRRGQSAPNLWLAMAIAAPLSMLPTYHFQHDAKILLLSVPACVMLWAKRGATGWLAMLLTGAGIVINGDIFSGIRITLTRHILVPQAGFFSHVTTAVLTRPAPLVLLALAALYLWIYMRPAVALNGGIKTPVESLPTCTTHGRGI